MAPTTTVAPSGNERGNCAEAHTRGSSARRSWLARTLELSACCLVLHCGGGSSAADLGGGSGGSNASTGSGDVANSGGSASVASASGGSKAAGGAQTTGRGGASVANEAGGAANSGGTESSSGGTARTGGSGGSKPISGAGGAAAGGAVSTGGAAAAGGTAAGGTTGRGSGGSRAGGAANAGGTTNNAGAANAGGAPGTGGKSGGSAGSAGGTSSSGGTFTVTSPGWTNTPGCGPDAKTSCSPLPTAMTRSGAGTSPELEWTGAPEGTKSFAVLFQDLNNKTAHWILWNIPSTVTKLAANVDRSTATPATPAGSQQCGKGTDAATSDGYYGPGAPCNVYELIVYALGVATFSPTDATNETSVRTQLQGLGTSILGTATMRGRTNEACN